MGLLVLVGVANSVTVPPVVNLPILPPRGSVNHRALSGPVTIACGEAGTGNSENSPAVVMRPIMVFPDSVNHSAWSGPTVIAPGCALGDGRGNSVTWPVPLAIRPILPAVISVNQRLSSGPRTRPHSPAAGVGIPNSLTGTEVATTVGTAAGWLVTEGSWLGVAPPTEVPGEGITPGARVGIGGSDEEALGPPTTVTCLRAPWGLTTTTATSAARTRPAAPDAAPMRR